jgi:hypothetical protein
MYTDYFEPATKAAMPTDRTLLLIEEPAFGRQVDLHRAQAILEDFARFWDAEPEPAERRKLILSLFAQVWAKDNEIVAVKPNPAFANYFTAASEARATHPKADAGDEATNTGATGVEPCPDTAHRMPHLAGRLRAYTRRVPPSIWLTLSRGGRSDGGRTLSVHHIGIRL